MTLILVPFPDPSQDLDHQRKVWKNVAATYGGRVEENLDRARRTNLDAKVIWARPDDAIEWSCPLRNYEHPEHGIYVFGADHGPVPEPDENDDVVTIETAYENGALWSFLAMGIVFYDRYRKGLT